MMNLNKQVFEVDWQAIHGQVAAADNTRPSGIITCYKLSQKARISAGEM